MQKNIQLICTLSKSKFKKKHSKVIQYGTAGFRTKGEDLEHVLFRMGVLAVLRSKVKKATIGAMITASHNPEEDNGVKLVDPMGEMLESSWESIATKLANIDDDDIATELNTIIQQENIDENQPANVFFARDTRPSSEHLASALQEGITAAGGNFQNFGLLTTPQLHYMVRCVNTNNNYGQPTADGYYNKLTTAFRTLYKQGNKNYKASLVIDAANGIGAIQTKLLNLHIKDLLHIELRNDGSSGRLNHECGADYVKVQQKPPAGIDMKPGTRCLSYDGDADRIVYYYGDKDNTFHLLDGDKIATLVAGYLKNLMSESGLKLNLGLVQTAYANGSSTDYITNKLQVPVACVPTGVKHLHHRALEFDIGVYFEANGHGTVLFSDKATQTISNATKDTSKTEAQRKSASCLLTVIDLINQTVGDAISDMLLVELILSTQGWNAEQWNQAYIDLPNRQLKVKVKDRSVIQTTDAERKTTAPAGLQEAIDKLVSGYLKGRSFVRPSGTEDVVRVYAEADTRVNADKLAAEVGAVVYDLAGGQGERPL
ncbi:phosphoacetylglucosamine mutase-like [Mytilus californianus]|uniref:phosphoacetylglucosamine mutase-like n=1 Tax=Mytilus californianus TaxID=6549 RepID=UPI0022479F12|nr:phosphoacetylglucosamine mutase-like [Mytilus californianus]